VLYVCATPIGNLDDVTRRVLDALRSVDLIAAEDTRRTRKLLARYDIHTPATSLFAHNEAEKTGYVLGLLREGRDVALVTDAGLPGVSDPGLRLVAAAAAAGLPLTVLPGPSAPATAAVASGLAGDAGYRFVGYLPRRAAQLRAAFAGWRRCGGLVVAFETGRRLAASLHELAALAPDACGAVCRELTKVHEEVARGTLTDLALRFTGEVKGEITVVIDVGGSDSAADAEAAAEHARAAAASLLDAGLTRRDAAAALAVCLGLRRNEAKRVVDDASAGRQPAVRDSEVD
jgi:16S rRNA (cytidine1402-2'-O)-methyltransferase